MPDVRASVTIPVPREKDRNPEYLATRIEDQVAPYIDEMREAGLDFRIVEAEVRFRLEP